MQGRPSYASAEEREANIMRMRSLRAFTCLVLGVSVLGAAVPGVAQEKVPLQRTACWAPS